MFGINEVKAMITASDARSMRQHSEIMEELHDLNMQLETFHDVLDRAMAELTPKAARPAPITKTTTTNAKGKAK